MTALTEDQLAQLHDELGVVDDADLQAKYDRLGDLTAVAQAVTSSRLQALLAAPAQFSVPGVISTGTAENIRALQAQLAKLAKDGLGDVTGAGQVLTVVKPRPRNRRR